MRDIDLWKLMFIYKSRGSPHWQSCLVKSVHQKLHIAILLFINK